MNYRDRRHYRRCLTCDDMVLPPRRKCNACRKPKAMKVERLRDSRRGMNKVGIAAHKPAKARTKRAKRQNADAMGQVPHIRTSNWRFV